MPSDAYRVAEERVRTAVENFEVQLTHCLKNLLSEQTRLVNGTAGEQCDGEHVLLERLVTRARDLDHLKRALEGEIVNMNEAIRR